MNDLSFWEFYLSILHLYDVKTNIVIRYFMIFLFQFILFLLCFKFHIFYIFERESYLLCIQSDFKIREANFKLWQNTLQQTFLYRKWWSQSTFSDKNASLHKRQSKTVENIATISSLLLLINDNLGPAWSKTLCIQTFSTFIRLYYWISVFWS